MLPIYILTIYCYIRLAYLFILDFSVDPLGDPAKEKAEEEHNAKEEDGRGEDLVALLRLHDGVVQLYCLLHRVDLEIKRWLLKSVLENLYNYPKTNL